MSGWIFEEIYAEFPARITWAITGKMTGVIFDETSDGLARGTPLQSIQEFLQELASFGGIARRTIIFGAGIWNL